MQGLHVEVTRDHGLSHPWVSISGVNNTFCPLRPTASQRLCWMPVNSALKAPASWWEMVDLKSSLWCIHYSLRFLFVLVDFTKWGSVTASFLYLMFFTTVAQHCSLGLCGCVTPAFAESWQEGPCPCALPRGPAIKDCLKAAAAGDAWDFGVTSCLGFLFLWFCCWEDQPSPCRAQKEPTESVY